MAFISINGIVIKTPATCTWSISDESSSESGRTLDGTMHKDMVAQKRKLVVKWGPCMWAEAMKITRYCKNKGVQVAVTYPDIMAGGMLTKPFYTGDCTVQYHEWHGQITLVSNILCDFIEI